MASYGGAFDSGYGGAGGDPRSDPRLQQAVAEEQRRAMVQAAMGKLTHICWDLCITSKPSSSFSRREGDCLTNCSHRYLDTSMFVLAHMQGKGK
eukprot:PLAT14988.1.p1 GENE.PLAT14988.1~~PLAT14988.1.p1  ORF type:complete len:101 (+),score=39.24 PLAT14988.1:24-305(+)